MRISGMVSGLDNDEIVNNMMRVERMKVDRFAQQKQLFLWKQESYNTMNKMFANFILSAKKDLGLNKTSSTGVISSASYKNLDYVKKASSSNESSVAIKSTTSSAANGSYEIEVVKLAKQDRSSIKMSSTDRFDSDIVVNGVKIEAEGKSASQVAKLISDNKELKSQDASAFYDKNTGRLFISANHNGGSGISISKLGSSNITIDGLATSKLELDTVLAGEIKVNGQVILANGGSVEDLINGINEKFDTIEASLVDGKITFSNKVVLDGFTNEDLELDGELSGPIMVNGVELLAEGGTVKDLIGEINEKIDGVKATLKDGKIELSADVKLEGLELTNGGLGLKTKLGGPITIAGQEIISNGESATLGQILDKINNGNSGYHASYVNGEIIVEARGDSLGEDGTVGSYAEIKINGHLVETKYATNDIEFNGVKLELKEVGTSTIKVESNVEGMMEKIQKFVDDYNNMIDLVSGAVNEKKYSSYHPLSQEEKNAMHESDVKLWEEKARSGMLNKDENLNRLMQNIRGDLYKTVEGLDGVFKNITEIGITTEKYAKGAAGGKLQIDEEKLRKALEENPEDVMELLFADEVKTEGATKSSSTMNKGVLTSVFDNMIDGMKSIIEKSGTGDSADLFRSVKSNILMDFVTSKSSTSDIDRQVREMDKKIDNLNILLNKREDSYYAKFTAMEKYMQKMSSQSAWIGQQMM